MSTTTGTSYTARSMNGIITIDDGQGTTISDGKITTGSITLDTLYCDNIQTKTSTDNAYLYTNTSGIITIGTNATVSTNTLSSNNITAVSPSADVQVYQNNTGSIAIGDSSTGLINIGTAKPSGYINIGTTGGIALNINTGANINGTTTCYALNSSTIGPRILSDNVSLYQNSSGTITMGGFRY